MAHDPATCPTCSPCRTADYDRGRTRATGQLADVQGLEAALADPTDRLGPKWWADPDPTILASLTPQPKDKPRD